ncbi:NUDIX domain-containing protein [Candidatus Saccharibacteria bacterium]|nr:NUDIX domain-containing protein [Candidatus Saccharibacteria bacterium]
MHTNEFWQLYYKNGEPIPGSGWKSSRDNPNGDDTEIVGVVVIFLYKRGKDGLEFLWQRRSEGVSRYPGDYDISAGGHVNLGESLIEASIRELQEEIGVKITASELNFVTMRPFNKNRFAWIYAVDWTRKGNDFKFNDKEVSEVKWVKYNEMTEFREKYAKKPLKKDKLTFLALEEWLRQNGNL